MCHTCGKWVNDSNLNKAVVDKISPFLQNYPKVYIHFTQ